MAKRSNPFVEDYIPQSKIHVGLKQFNNNGQRLQKVYEKTLKMLFRGAKKPSLIHHLNSMDEMCNKRDKMKQLHIEKDGTLSKAGLMVEHTVVPVDKCKCGSNAVETGCAYCEAVLCGACQQCCVRCAQLYCCNCCIM